MSLKTRLRLAVAVLMSAMVVVLSGLYIRNFLETAFARAHEMASSLGDQLQAGIRDELQQMAHNASPKPASADEYRAFWERTAENDPRIKSALVRATGHWQLVQEIFITDQTGRILTSSMPGRTGLHETFAPNLAEWHQRSVVDNLRLVWWNAQDTQIRRPLAIAGENAPVLTIHVVVNSIFLRKELSRGLDAVWAACIAVLVVSIVLALILPNFVLNPLERLSHSLDLMTTGEFRANSQPAARESKEFAAVYSKLDVLGRQYLGAQESVDQLRGNVEQLLERLEEAVLLFDATGHLTMAGRAVARLIGKEPQEIVGRDVDEVFPPDTEIGALVGPAIRDGEMVRSQTVPVQIGERESPVVVNIQPVIRNHPGPRVGSLMTLRDAATRGELAAHLDMAGRLTALSQLTRGVAHEIKNPLNAITLHLEVLKSRLDDEAPEVGVIGSEISRLDRVVKTFLDFNRPLEPHLCPTDLNELARDIGRLVAPDGESKSIHVEVRTKPRPLTVNADPDLIKQAILNVVMNALEAMKSGGDLTIETTRTSSGMELSVTDTGPGIPPEIRDKIFNLYFSTKEHGSGIGLAMTFRLVQLHDGRIDFFSEIGRGTTFRFTFPEAASPISPQSQIELSRGHTA